MSVAQRLLVSAAIVLQWAVTWGALLAAIAALALRIDPAVVDQGEYPADMFWIAAAEGARTGIVFAMLLAVAERRRRIAEIPLARAVLWGVVAAAVLRVTAVSDVHFSNTAVAGAIAALVSIGMARAV